MKKTRIISVILVFAMMLSFNALYVFSDGESDYEQLIYAYGDSDLYMGSCPGYAEGSTSFSAIQSPLWNGVSAEVGKEDRTYGLVKGYGKEDGDKIYRFTKLEWYGDFQLACFGHGVLTEKRDQVGELSYRLDTEQALRVASNRWDNENVAQIQIPRTDNLWHRLTWAYNSAIAETSIWVDGVYFGKLSGKTAGLWILTSAWLCEGEFIEIDDLRAWTLKPEASAIVSGEGENAVYESYNRIVSEKLCNIEFPALEGEDFIASSTEDSITVDNAPTCADVIYEAENNEGVTGAVIYNSDFTEILGDGANPGGGILVVEKTAASGSKAYGYYKILDDSLYFEYQKEIVADGEKAYMGNAPGWSEGALNWAAVAYPTDKGCQVVTVDSENGYGKKTGDKIYSFTGDAIPGSWYQFFCFANGVPGASGDMVGEFNYRLGSEQGFWLLANRSYNGATADDRIVTIPYKDSLWHTLSFTYNSVSHDTVFYIDGEFFAKITFPLAGFWVVSSNAIPAGKTIEFDNLKAYYLTQATSGITHEGDNGTVYDSFDYIVKEKFDISGQYEINTSDIITSADAIKVEVAMGTSVEALVSDIMSDSTVSYAAVIDKSTGAELDGGELASDGILAVSKINKAGNEIIKYYTVVDPSSSFEYEKEIYSDGQNFWLGNAPGYSEGALNWSSTSYPYNVATSETVGATIPGFGKLAGDKILRYTGAGIAGSWYQFLCFGNGVPGASGDMVGELNYRLGDGNNMWIMGNRAYNNATSDIIVLPYKDDLWHHLTFAYNSVTHETTFWNDGEYMNKLTFPTAGLWLVSSAGVTDGKSVDIDEFKAWSLTLASSGITHTQDGEVIYDSYNYIVNSKLDNNTKAKISTGEIILSAEENTIGILEGSTCLDVIAEVEDSDEALKAVVFDMATGFECGETEAAEGKLLAVSKADKNGVNVITYYNIVKEEKFKYLPEIYANGEGFYMGNAAGYTDGAQNWASAGNPYNCGTSVTVGGDIAGYGKKDGDKIIRFTSAGIPSSWYQYFCFGNGIPGKNGDFAGTIEYRLGSEQDIWIMSNRSYNGSTSEATRMITLPYQDTNWHTLSFAYNSVTHETTFWIDGEYMNTMTFPTAGLWLVSSNKITDGKSIDFDNLKMWNLTEETSGITYEADGKTVYESYDFIVSDKLGLKPQLNASEDGSYYILNNKIIAKKGAKVSDIAKLSADVTIIGKDGKAVTDANAEVSGDMSAVVSDKGMLRTYRINVYNEGNGILYSDVFVNGSEYCIIVYNSGDEGITVNAYTKNIASGKVKPVSITVDAGGERGFAMGNVTEEALKFYLWNDALMPLSKPLGN